jgi:hypothetical protein
MPALQSSTPPVLTTTTPSPASSSPAGRAPTQSPTHKTGPGVIAGATIGGIVVLLIIGLAIWYSMFRKRKSQPPEEQQVMQEQIYEADSKHRVVEADGRGVSEVDGGYGGRTWAHMNRFDVSELSEQSGALTSR